MNNLRTEYIDHSEYNIFQRYISMLFEMEVDRHSVRDLFQMSASQIQLLENHICIHVDNPHKTQPTQVIILNSTCNNLRSRGSPTIH